MTPAISPADDDFIKPSKIEILAGLNQYHVLCPDPPLSLQASSDRKEAYKTQLRSICPQSTSVFTGKIECELRWFVSPKFFYEHGHRADIDNIIKPTLDAFSGREGLWVDDTQVEKIVSRAILRPNEGEGWFALTIDFSNSDCMPKDKAFLEVDDKFCRPSLARQGQFGLGKALLEQSPTLAHGFLAIDRPFFKGHVWLGGFEIKRSDGTLVARPVPPVDSDES